MIVADPPVGHPYCPLGSQPGSARAIVTIQKVVIRYIDIRGRVFRDERFMVIIAALVRHGVPLLLRRPHAPIWGCHAYSGLSERASSTSCQLDYYPDTCGRSCHLRGGSRPHRPSSALRVCTANMAGLSTSYVAKHYTKYR